MPLTNVHQLPPFADNAQRPSHPSLIDLMTEAVFTIEEGDDCSFCNNCGTTSSHEDHTCPSCGSETEPKMMDGMTFITQVGYSHDFVIDADGHTCLGGRVLISQVPEIWVDTVKMKVEGVTADMTLGIPYQYDRMGIGMAISDLWWAKRS
jgi:hypothetical protein